MTALPVTVEKTVIATSAKRLFAFLVDYSIIMLLMMGVHPVFLPMKWNQLEFLDIIVALIPVYLLAILLMIGRDLVTGRSLGKAMMNMQVTLVQDGLPTPDSKTLILRNLFILILPVELVYLLIDKHHRRLGDRFAGTMVVDHKYPPVVRRLTVKMVAAMLVFATLWMTYTIFTPIGIRKTSGYQTATEAIQKSPDVREVLGEIQEMGGSLDVEIKEGQTIYRILVTGSRAKKRVQVIVETITTKDTVIQTENILGLMLLEEET